MKHGCNRGVTIQDRNTPSGKWHEEKGCRTVGQRIFYSKVSINMNFGTLESAKNPTYSLINKHLVLTAQMRGNSGNHL